MTTLDGWTVSIIWTWLIWSVMVIVFRFGFTAAWMKLPQLKPTSHFSLNGV